MTTFLIETACVSRRRARLHILIVKALRFPTENIPFRAVLDSGGRNSLNQECLEFGLKRKAGQDYSSILEIL